MSLQSLTPFHFYHISTESNWIFLGHYLAIVYTQPSRLLVQSFTYSRFPHQADRQGCNTSILPHTFVPAAPNNSFKHTSCCSWGRSTPDTFLSHSTYKLVTKVFSLRSMWFQPIEFHTQNTIAVMLWVSHSNLSRVQQMNSCQNYRWGSHCVALLTMNIVCYHHRRDIPRRQRTISLFKMAWLCQWWRQTICSSIPRGSNYLLVKVRFHLQEPRYSMLRSSL